MTMQRRRSVRAAFGLFAASLYALSVWIAAPASADPDLTVHWRVDASTHLAKLNMDVTVPRGTFDGVIDLGTGDLTGDLTLPPAEVRLDAAGILPLVDATFAITQAQPITGRVDFESLFVTSTAVFDIRVVRASPALLPGVNLVGDNCRTSIPISVTMEGPVDLAGGSTFTGGYTIPPLENCGVLTAGLNLVIPGDGNTFTGTFSPPPPPVANAGPDAVVESEASFDLDGSASSDPENRPITFLWTQVSGPAAILTNERTARPTVKAPKGPATLVFRATVTNSDGGTASDDVTITVNRAPK